VVKVKRKVHADGPRVVKGERASKLGLRDPRSPGGVTVHYYK